MSRMGLIYILILHSLACASFGLASQAYEPVREYAGKDFFMGWDIDVNDSYIDQNTIPQETFTYVDSSTGHAIIRVGNTSDTGSIRNGSVRITSKDTYSVGNLILIDAISIPSCSVLPSFLAPGSDLSSTGELHLIGGMDGTTANQRQLPANYVEQPQSPKTFATDASYNHQVDWKLDSEGGKGGVFALRIDVEEVVMWFWNRRDIPPSIAQAQAHAVWDIDPSSWGEPKMVYPAARDGSNVDPDTEQARFRSQKLVLGVIAEHVEDRTSQGKGYAKTYAEPGECAIQSNSSAYWEISHIRIFTQAQNPGQKPERQLLARRSQAGMDITSSKTTSSSSLSLIIPSNGTAWASISFSIFDPTIETSQVPTITSTDAPVVTQGDTEPTAVVATVTTTSVLDGSGDGTGTSSATSSQTEQNSEVTSTVLNATLGGSARSITVTFGEGGADLVSFAGAPVDGAITSTVTGTLGFSSGVDGTSTSSSSSAPVNAGSVTGVDILVMVVGSLLLVQW
ncbi:hypothetical protein VNI00_010929 [Paramarasmius palmivorus]|uniref:Uncharacterized protein n=1 Tax=Paramarasmius palmivorus TaxID=297713 RepID=A0AAW0CF93_9AGAR